MFDKNWSERKSTKRSQKMGAFLEKPNTEKHNENGEGNGLRFGVSSMQGEYREFPKNLLDDNNLVI